MARIYNEPWQQQQQWLLAALQAAAQPGGALAGYLVEEVVPPESDGSQLIGLQFRDATDKTRGQNVRVQTARFELMVVVVRSFDPTSSDAARETKLLAENAWNDMAGNGLGPVLRADPSLGGNAYDSTIEHAITVGRGILDENETSAVVSVMLTAVAEFPTF